MVLMQFRLSRGEAIKNISQRYALQHPVNAVAPREKNLGQFYDFLWGILGRLFSL